MVVTTCKTRGFIVVLLAALGAAGPGSSMRVARYVLPTGKCNTYHIEPKPIDYDKLSKFGRWNIVYVPDAEPFRQLDHAYIEVSPNTDDSYRVVVFRTTKDGTKSSQIFKQRYIDNVIAEVSGHGSKNYTHQHNYPLATIGDDALLILRCSDNGRRQFDTRYVIARDGIKLSESGKQELFEADNKFNFRGGFYKLPYALA